MNHLSKQKLCCLILSLSLFSSYTYAQNPLLNGEAFDSRYENHSKNMRLLGRVQSIEEKSYRSQRNKDTLAALKLEYTIIYHFNINGNLNEKTQLRPDGSIADKAVFEYDTRGQLTAVTHYRENKYESKTISLVNQQKNTVQSNFYIGEYSQSFSTLTKYYNQKGQKIKRTIKDSKAKIATIDFKYDTVGNLIETNQDGYRMISQYDSKHYYIGGADYDNNGKLLNKTYYKNDKFGNYIEVSDERVNNSKRFKTYNYDKFNNWVKSVTKDSDGKYTVERTIIYY